ncbi:MAG: hypothetical protein M1522_00505, partial [Actinobacteria bacterium]|nr:hypothetical protein [Actinomycetota bacterium]
MVLPQVVVVGLGPAGLSLVPRESLDAMAGAARVFVRTVRHPAAEELLTGHAGDWATRIEPCDHHYEAWGSFDEVYRAIVEEVVAAAGAAAGAAAEGATAVGGLGPPYVAYAVPGSPFVAERTVAMLSDDPRVSVRVLPAPS